MPPYLRGAVAAAPGSSTADVNLALLTNGTLAAWTATGPATNLPPGLTNLVAVETSVGTGGQELYPTDVNLVLRSNGTVVAWGSGTYGLTNLPPALSNVVALAGGATHAVALENDGGPLIVRPPIGGTFYSGADLVLKAKAIGALPLSSRWFKDGNPLPSATNQSLVVSAAQASDAGSYQFVVTNALGAAQSVAVPIVIMDSAPVLLSQPVSGFAYYGSPFSVGASVIGSGQMQLTWLQNGSPIAGGTNQLYADRALPQHGGAYQLIASNPFGSITSSVAQIPFSRLASWGKGPNLTNPPCDLGSVLAVASGWYHALAIQSNHTVAAWGTTLNGATNVPPGLSNVVAVAGGNYFSAALLADGTVTSWGLNSNGQTNVPAGLSNVVAIACGGFHTLALRANGTVYSWGYNAYGQVPVPAGLSNVVAISAGAFTSLALKSDGNIVAWGSAGKIPAYTNVVAISAGGGWQGLYFSAALRGDGTLVAWGNNANNQLLIPSGLLSATAISAGGGSSLAYLGDRSPFFTVQPWNRTIGSGNNFSFRAFAVGQPLLAYQWYYNGQAIAGATSNALAFANTLPTQNGAYQLVAMNTYGVATSAVATLTVTVPPVKLMPLGLAANGFRFSFISLPAVLYIVEFKSTLPAGAWTELERRFGIGGLEIVTDASASTVARYYRVRALFAPPPRVAAPTWSGNALNFSFATVPGAVYVVQYKAYLNDT